jgi:hypothetical protein
MDATPRERGGTKRRIPRTGAPVVAVVLLAVGATFVGPASPASAGRVNPTPSVREPRDGQQLPARPAWVKLYLGSAKLVGARLNGRQISDDLKGRRRGRAAPCVGVPAALTRGVTCKLRASPSHGLRYGKNMLKARFKRHHKVRVRRVPFRVARHRPLAAAGRNTFGDPRQRIHLNARPSLIPPTLRHRLARSGKRAKLRYRWRLVDRPRGNHGKLTGAHTSRPTLELGRRGRYKLRLTVTGQNGRTGRDSVVVHSATQGGPAATDPPPAIPIDTMAQQQGHYGIQVGQNFYAADPGSWAQVVALDRRTGEPVTGDLANKSYPCTLDSQDQLNQCITSLATDLHNLDGKAVAIVSSPPDGPFSNGIEEALFFAKMIPDATKFEVGSVRPGGSISAIGMPGQPSVGNWHPYVGPPVSTHDGGRMRDYIVRTNAGDPKNQIKAGDYVFAPTDHVDFDTQAAGSTDSQNVIQVGDQKFTQSFDGGIRDGGGFQVVVLDAQTLQPVSSMPPGGYWFETDHSNRQALDDQITAMRDVIHGANASLNQTGQREIVLISSLGDPAIQYYKRSGASPDDSLNTDIAQLVNEVEQLGGTRNAFYEMLDPALYGNHGYSYTLLSESYSGAGQGQELVGTGITGNGTGPLNMAPISGTLTRTGPAYEFRLDGSPRVGPEASGRDPSRATSELKHIAFQAPTPWPEEDPSVFPDAAERTRKEAAIRWVGLHSDLHSDDPRGQYWTVALKDDQFNTDKWDKVAFSIQGLDYSQVSADDQTKFTKDDLEWAKTELAGSRKDPAQVGGEIRWLEETHDYMEELATPVMRNANGAWGLMSEAVAEIQSHVDATKDHSVEAKTTGAIFRFAVGLGGFLPEVGEGFYAFADIYDLAQGLLEIDGEPATEDTFPSTAGKLANDLATRFQGARQALVEQLPNVIAADYGKLKTVGSCAMLDAAKCPYDVRDWQYTQANQDQAQAALTDGTKLWAYAQLLPAKYQVFALPSWWRTQVNDDFYGFDTDGTVYRPFDGLQEGAEFAKPIYRNIPYYTHKTIRGSGPGWSMTGGSDRWQIFTLGYLDGAGTYTDPWRMRWPSAEVTDPLFNQPSKQHPNYLGADPETFFDSAFGPTTDVPLFEHYPRPGDGVAWCYHLASSENCP